MAPTSTLPRRSACRATGETVDEYVIPDAGVLVVAGAGDLAGVGFAHCRGIGYEVGARRRPVVEAARALARSRAAQGLARVARRAVQTTPYGRAALGVVDAARRVARREGGRAAALSVVEPSALRPSSLTDAQRVELVRALLASKLSPTALRTALVTVVS